MDAAVQESSCEVRGLSTRIRGSLRSAVLIAAAVLVYHRALFAYFFDDDFQWLTDSLSFVPSNLWAFERLTHFYRPVIDLYFAAATHVLHGSPVLLHAASIAVHAANGLVLLAVLRRLTGNAFYGFVAALFFVVQPAGVEAVAWVGALAEAVGALFGCLSVLWFLEWRETRRRPWHALSCGAFMAALLTHESSVIFLLVIVLADWVIAGGRLDGQQTGVLTRTADRLRAYLPYALLLAVYLAIDLSINSRNYVVTQGHYALGWHIVRNIFGYLVALYVGRADLANYLLIVVVLATLILRGNRRVRFATFWMLLALAPFVPFNWSNTSRYMYQPAIGLSMLFAEAIVQLDRYLSPRMPQARRAGLVGLVIAAVALRFAVFAMHNVDLFAGRTEVYRRQADVLKQAHPELRSHSVVVAEPALKAAIAYPFANAMIAWEYRDPTIQLEPY